MRPAPFFVSGPVPRPPRPRPRPLHRGRPLFRFRHREAPPFRVPGAVPVFPPSLSPFPPQPRVRPSRPPAVTPPRCGSRAAPLFPRPVRRGAPSRRIRACSGARRPAVSPSCRVRTGRPLLRCRLVRPLLLFFVVRPARCGPCAARFSVMCGTVSSFCLAVLPVVLRPPSFGFP